MLPLTRSLAVAALALVPAAAQAQLLTLRDNEFGPRMRFGINFTVAQPLEEFSDYVNTGFGATGSFTYKLDRRGIFGIRLDGGFLQYDNEKKRVCVSSTIGCRVQVDLTTSNNIFVLGIGPELSVPSGFIRPYVSGSVGLAYFFTESSVEGTRNDDQPFASTTNYDDGKLAYTGTAGVLIPVRAGRQPVFIDFGARYHRNGEMRYLRKGSIIDNPDGSITINPIRSEANLLTYHLGVQVGIPISR